MDQICIVTGASSGIGRSTAIHLAMKGVHTVLGGRNQSRLEETASACRAQGVAAVAVPGDVADPDYAPSLFDHTRFAELGGSSLTDRPITLDAQSTDNGVRLSAVFAAGVATFGETVGYPVTAWKNAVDTNLSGLFYCCQAAIAAMLGAGGGRIVNVLSVAARTAFPASAAYVATKFGGLGLTHSLNAEYRAQGIALTAFLPGSVDSPLWAGKEWMPEKADMLTCEEVADAICAIVLSPHPGAYDEVLFMPQKGVL
jgi:short-subunit dehydrogenase